MRKNVKLLVISTVILLVAACTPKIESVDIIGNTPDEERNPPRHENPMFVKTYIEVYSGGADMPQIYLRPVFPSDQEYTYRGSLTEKEKVRDIPIDIGGEIIEFSGYEYTGEINTPLQYGGYQIRVSIPYRAWLSRREESFEKKFLVEGPASCFCFDYGLSGFDVETVRKSNGDVFNDLNIFLNALNWPVSTDTFPEILHGSVSLQILATIYPRPEDENYYWFADFVSPNLEENPDWIHAPGITLRMTTQAVHVYAQPIFVVQPEVGEPVYWAPKDQESGKFLVYAIGIDEFGSADEWKVIEWMPSEDIYPEGSVLSEVRIRVYGDPKLNGNNHEMNIYLDGVCPKPLGIDPSNGIVVEPEINPWQ